MFSYDLSIKYLTSLAEITNMVKIMVASANLHLCSRTFFSRHATELSQWKPDSSSKRDVADFKNMADFGAVLGR